MNVSRSTDQRTRKLRFRHVPGYGWYRSIVAAVILMTEDEWLKGYLANTYLNDCRIDHRYSMEAIKHRNRQLLREQNECSI